jgi:hypothetical protein
LSPHSTDLIPALLLMLYSNFRHAVLSQKLLQKPASWQHSLDRLNQVHHHRAPL